MFGSVRCSGHWFRLNLGAGLRLSRRTKWLLNRRNGLGLTEPTDDHVKDGSEKDTEYGHAQHAAKDGYAERLPHFGASTFGQNQGNHSEDEGKRCHQDRAQSQPACFHGGFDAALASVLE